MDEIFYQICISKIQHKQQIMIDQQTICAISTASGTGAIAMIRLSGNNALTIADSIFRSVKASKKLDQQKGGTFHFGTICDNNNEIVDEVIAAVFKAPHSFTGENMVEISCHGSSYIQQKVLQLLIDNGARMAKPGE
ncbi:MAG TPA: hypothetical protein PLS94_14800, partial [Prolixibacteraceae bacterium]|nr:hypothetical protein [Prolixibacteraceae bacterium]